MVYGPNRLLLWHFRNAVAYAPLIIKLLNAPRFGSGIVRGIPAILLDIPLTEGCAGNPNAPI